MKRGEGEPKRERVLLGAMREAVKGKAGKDCKGNRRILGGCKEDAWRRPKRGINQGGRQAT